MLQILTYLANRKSDERGAVAIEYGLLATLIALAFIVGAGLLGDELDALFTDIANRLGV